MLHTALWVDAAFELVAGAVLLLLAGSVANWLDADRAIVSIAGVIFLGASAAIAGFALQPAPARRTVSTLAALNLIGGVAIWCVLPFVWSGISGEGRWMAAAIADSFIAVAALEFLALQRGAPATGVTR
ncbi:MAG: hypothetical protein C0506_00670 [Anaerolinea sp.]|nr:hypothetical protein [Anaerolinea sp.]